MNAMRTFWKERGRALFALLLLIALTVCAVLYAQSRIFPPKKEALLAVSGVCRSTEYGRIALERDGEALGSYKLDERVEPDAGRLLRSIEPGDEAELLYIDDEDRTVMELTVNGETLLTYDRASAMWSQSTARTAGTILLGVVGALLALAGAAAAAVWKGKRKTARVRAEAEDAVREELRLYAGVRYGEDERRAIEAYIADAFGPVGRVYYELDGDVPHIDLAVCEPGRGRPLYTAATVGLGAFRLSVPEELEERNRSFAELTMLLPRGWDFAEDGWPLTTLKSLAREIVVSRDGAPLGGNAYYLSGEEREASGFAAVLVVPASVREGSEPRVMIPGGKIVNFYLLVPIYEEEWDYIFARGSSARLWQRMAEHGVGAFVQPGRERCVDPETWFDEDIVPFYYGENPARGEYYLGLSDFTYLADRFAAQGVEPDGPVWERIARECLRDAEWRDTDEIEFSSSGEMLLLESGNETLLRRFALLLHDSCEDGETFAPLLIKSMEETDGA